MNTELARLTILCSIFFFVIEAGYSQDQVRVGVWNIEKMSSTASRGFPETSGLGARTDSQLDAMAQYIKDELEVDALMVSEIEADSPFSTDSVPQSKQLNHVAAQLGPDWKYFLGRTGGKLRLGLLFNTKRVRLKKLLNLHASQFNITGRDVLDRDPFIAWIEFLDNAGESKNDVLLIGVHLKSIQGRFRNNRMAAVAKIIGDVTDKETRSQLTLPSRHEEKEIIVLGDCNDSSFDDAGFQFMFDYLDGTGFKHIQPASGDYPATRVNGTSKIDHVFATSKVIADTLVSESFQVHTVPSDQRDEYRSDFSDHFPVTIDLKLASDSDLTLDEALLVADDAERGTLLAEMSEDIAERVDVPSEDIDDEESDSPPEVEFDVIDTDFQRILAPQLRADDSDLTEGVPAIDRADSRNAAIRTAVEAIRDSIDSLLGKQGDLSRDDRQRLRGLIVAERELQQIISRDN